MPSGGSPTPFIADDMNIFHKYWSCGCGYRMVTFPPRFGHSIRCFIYFAIIKLFMSRFHCVVQRLDSQSHHPRAWWRHQMEAFSALLAFVRGIHRSPVNSPHKGQWRGALMFSLIWAWTNSWANNGDAGDLRHHRAHYDVIVMITLFVWRILFAPESNMDIQYAEDRWYLHIIVWIEVPSAWLNIISFDDCHCWSSFPERLRRKYERAT